MPPKRRQQVEKKRRAPQKNSKNSLQLVHNRSLPVQLQRSVLTFLAVHEACDFGYLSKDCRRVLVGFLSTTTTIAFSNEYGLENQTPLTDPLGLLLSHARRLRSITVPNSRSYPGEPEVTDLIGARFLKRALPKLCKLNSATLEEVVLPDDFVRDELINIVAEHCKSLRVFRARILKADWSEQLLLSLPRFEELEVGHDMIESLSLVPAALHVSAPLRYLSARPTPDCMNQLADAAPTLLASTMRRLHLTPVGLRTQSQPLQSLERLIRALPLLEELAIFDCEAVTEARLNRTLIIEAPRLALLEMEAELAFKLSAPLQLREAHVLGHWAAGAASLQPATQLQTLALMGRDETCAEIVALLKALPDLRELRGWFSCSRLRADSFCHMRRLCNLKITLEAHPASSDDCGSGLLQVAVLQAAIRALIATAPDLSNIVVGLPDGDDEDPSVLAIEEPWERHAVIPPERETDWPEHRSLKCLSLWILLARPIDLRGFRFPHLRFAAGYIAMDLSQMPSLNVYNLHAQALLHPLPQLIAACPRLTDLSVQKGTEIGRAVDYKQLSLAHATEIQIACSLPTDVLRALLAISGDRLQHFNVGLDRLDLKEFVAARPRGLQTISYYGNLRPTEAQILALVDAIPTLRSLRMQVSQRVSNACVKPLVSRGRVLRVRGEGDDGNPRGVQWLGLNRVDLELTVAGSKGDEAAGR